MTTYGTTTYVPSDGGHRFAPTLVERPEGDRVEGGCGDCGGRPWDALHALTEQHASDYTGPLTYAVEASDDGGRSYAANGLRWAEQDAAERWAGGLAMRWFGATNIRVVRCTSDGTPTGEVVHQTL